MRIASVHLKGYKRFTDLRVHSIPESARLVVLVGPNGSGKSSLFDAFLLKSQSRSNYGLDEDAQKYYLKQGFEGGVAASTLQVRGRIEVSLHEAESLPDDALPAAFYVRSAYRNESHFRSTSIEPTRPASERPRFQRIIDGDQAVSDNYKRLIWKRNSDLDHDAPADTTFGEYRAESLRELQSAMGKLFPGLELESFGGTANAGTFLFSKGTSRSFDYQNLSGGEKAAFDILLDLFVKRHEYPDAIYCIDEPEAHIATGLQGPLLESMLDLVPEPSQLWIATHSIGFVREASDRMRKHGDVAFLDFSGHDFDRDVEIAPRIPDRAFWRETYRIALDDLSELVAPEVVVVCEGSKAKADRGFDAQCYNRIFADSHPEALFISSGSSSEVEGGETLVAVLNAVSRGTKVVRLIDRDGMGDDTRDQKVHEGLRVLRRREIENYLYDPDVLMSFFREHDRTDVGTVLLSEFSPRLQEDDLGQVVPDLFQAIRTRSGVRRVGRNYKEFATDYLAPALARTKHVRDELCEDIFERP